MMSRLYYPAIMMIAFLIASCNSYQKQEKQLTTENTDMSHQRKMQVKVTGEGTPLLLVPGGLTGWASWDPFVEIFNSRNRKVIQVQLLSVQYGLEGRDLPTDYSVRMESEALSAALDSLDFNQPIDIVAWSYGAFTTLDYALNHPDHVRTLTLIEPPAFWVLHAEGLIDSTVQKQIDYFNTFKGDISEEKLAGFLREAGLLEEGQSPGEIPQWENWKKYRQSLRSNPSIMSHRDQIERLQDLKAPVLLIKGTGSKAYYHTIIDELTDHLPDARWIELPGAHAAHIVSRDRFLEELESFQGNQRQ